MKVLHVIPSVSARHGGPSVAIRALAAASRKNGLDVTIATTNDDGDAGVLDVRIGVPVECDGVPIFFFQRTIAPYKVSLGLVRWLRQRISEFDVVHIHALFSFASTAAARAARRTGVPYIVRPLGVLNRWGLQNRRRFLKKLSLRFVELPILQHAAAIHFTAESEREEAVAALPGIKRIPSFVLPIPVALPPNEGTASEFLKSYPLARDRTVVLYLSRLHPKKGVELLLKSFSAIKRAYPNALLVLTGDGEPSYVQSLRQLADNLGLEEQILWTGFLTGSAKWSAYAAASLYVLPSFSENFGIAPVEALMAGVPTLLSKEVAVQREIRAVDSGATLVFNPDQKSLQIALGRALADAKSRKIIGQKGKEVALKIFSMERVGERLTQEYSKLLNRPAGKGSARSEQGRMRA